MIIPVSWVCQEAWQDHRDERVSKLTKAGPEKKFDHAHTHTMTNSRLWICKLHRSPSVQDIADDESYQVSASDVSFTLATLP